MSSILLTPQPDHEGQPERRSSTPDGPPRRTSARAWRPVPSRSADPPRRATHSARLCPRPRSSGGGTLTTTPGGSMTTVETPTPEDRAGDRRPTPPPAARSWRGAVTSTEIDTRLFGMIAALRRDLDRLPHPLRRRLPDRPQPLEPVRPEHLHRHHGDGHGADHRVAQHRPVGRVAARLPRLHDGAGADGRDPVLLRRRPHPRPRRQVVHVARRPGRRACCSGRRSAASRVSSSPTSGCRRSSSPSAGSSSGAASSSGSATSRARRSPRSTRPSSCSAAAAPTARSASGAAGCSPSSPAAPSCSASGSPGAGASATTSRCARCGPRSCSASSAAARCSSGSGWSPTATPHRSRTSRPASPTRSSS